MIIVTIILCLFAWQKPYARDADWRYDDMASNIWQGTTGNWDTGSNWSLGSKPVNGDFVVFDGNISQQSVTSGHGNETAVTIQALWIKENYRGTIGSSSTPLDITIGANIDDYFLMQGLGTLHLAGNDRVICDSPNLLDAVALYGVESSVVMKRGRCDLTATHSALTFAIDMLGGKLVIAKNGASDKIGPIRMVGGEVVNSRDIDATVTMIVLAGGVWQQLVNGPDSGSAIIVVGSTLIWDAPDAAGTIPQVIIDSGVLDFNNTGDAKVVGSLVIMGGEVKLGPHVTITSTLDFRNTHPE